ncbi:GlcNac-binding protein A precursor [Erwinia amylovora Ea644]|uniref:N-acetylglucosamine-binding protein GbpA n=1 Tax=Erwinia amylovora TaxID=552 RepID=UPI0002C8DB8D|nr:N-acetylglucosamine-binding protein GbpA [Erwinia amylovora]CCP04154.1 GlcNac-binding protein A precursor [Erwinia amylovora Ea644]
MMKVNKLALAITTLLVSGSVFAHGYVTNPPSRDTMCKLSKNSSEICSDSVRYDTSAIGESTKGFPAEGTPPDGFLASGVGNEKGYALNVQNADIWTKNKITAGKNNFTWELTAPHKTANFKYFITKQGWDANKPLTRASFDLVPFCTIEGNGETPEPKPTHECVVPERTGYHVIYATWEVADTSNTFYKVIDVEFDGAVSSEWPKQVGTVNPYMDLKAGDSVKVRVFEDTEMTERSITLNIDSDAAGKKDLWSKALAEKINKEYQDLRAGSPNDDGGVEAVAGVNTIYTKKDSKIQSVEIDIDSKQVVQLQLDVNKLNKEYQLNKGAAKIEVTGTATAQSNLTATLTSKTRKQIDSQKVIVGADGKFALSLEGSKLKAGDYTVAVAVRAGSAEPVAKNQSVKLVENAGGGNVDADFTYPDNIGSYVAGTKVLQSANGKVYQCKDGAVAGWCQIYSKSANHYEPGVGSNWQDAWTEVGAAK